MQKFLIFSFVLWLISCSSTDATRRDYSASGDPEDIFFEKSQKNRSASIGSDDAVAKSIIDDLDTKSKIGTEPKTLPEKKANTSGDFDEVGLSSWYGIKFQGRPTASGEPFDRAKLTGAHRTLPIGSLVRIHNLENNKEAIVRINDRGPFVDERIVDVSEKAAELLEFKDKGVTKVGIRVLKKGDVADEMDSGELDDADLLDDVPAKPEKLSPIKPGNLSSKPIVAGVNPKGYTVQVGVFKEQEKANKYKETLKSEYNQSVFLYARDGKFIVQVGDFADRAKAESLKTRMKYDGIDCFIPPK